MLSKLKADVRTIGADIIVIRHAWQHASDDLTSGHLVAEISRGLAGHRTIDWRLARNMAIAATAASFLLAGVSIAWMLTPGSTAWIHAGATGAGAMVFGAMSALYWRLASGHHRMAAQASTGEPIPLLIEHKPAAEMPPVRGQERG